MDYIGAYYGMYFVEISDYYTRENSDEKEMLKLLYQSLRALSVPSLSKELVRYIFEMKSIVINGEFPGLPVDWRLEASTEYAVQFIVNAPIEKLFTFTVSDSVLIELEQLSQHYRSKLWDREFKSLEIIKTLC